MIFSEQQIREVVDIIKFQTSLFVAGNISTNVLSDDDKNILKNFGVDLTELEKDFTPFQQIYYFGRLASILKPVEASKLDFENFKKYLRRGQYLPLTSSEKATLTYLEKKTYNHIKGLEDKMTSFIEGKIREKNLYTRKAYENLIEDEIKRTVLQKDSVKSIVSDIGHATQDWERDLGRIAETELQDVYEHGKLQDINEKYGDEVEIYKHVYPGACQHCIRLYLTNGIGSQPILFTYEELLGNGTNIGRKVQDWKAVIGPVHPHCRCDIRKVFKGDIWDEETQSFIPPKGKVSREGVIKITIGDKIIEV